MSADNWAICPKCKSNREIMIKALRETVSASYGKATQDKFLAQMRDIANKETEEQEKTLREDYEMGMDEFGSFSIDYRAICSKCGFKYSYDYVASIPPLISNPK